MDAINLNGWLTRLGGIDKEWLWVAEVFVIVFITLFGSFFLRRFLTRLEGRLERTGTVWDDVLIEAVRRPAGWLVWVIGLGWAVQAVQRQAPSELLAMAGPARDLTVIALLAWFLMRIVRGAEQVLVQPDKVRTPMDETTAQAMGKLLRASIFITAVLVILQSLGFSISGVLAFGGIGGIAVGFAAKDLLANFFGGLMIYLDRPFAVGDWVRSPDREIEGTVEDIGWRLTRIRTFDKRPLYVPNAAFASLAVENPSRMSHRRIKETIGVRYEDATQVESIIAAVKAMLRDHPEIDTTQTLIVNLNAFGPSSLDFFIYTFTRTTNWVHYHEVKQDVLLRVLGIIAEHGAEVAYPTRTLHVAESDGAAVQLP